MPSTTYPDAVQVQGALRGYRAGRIRNLTTMLCHYTVGINSLGTCGRDFQFLQARNGVLYQGAEIDAVNWGAGDPWNGCSVHVEVEYLPGVDDVIITPAARESLRRFVHWLGPEWSLDLGPDGYYDGPRVPAWSGAIAHRAVIQTGDWHSNYWPGEDWAYISGEAPPEEEDRMKPVLCVQPDGKVVHYDPNTHTKTWIRTPEALSAVQALRALDGLPTDIVRNAATDGATTDARWIEDTPAGGSSAGGGPLQVQLSGTATPA